jgi:hypothetical protein
MNKFQTPLQHTALCNTSNKELFGVRYRLRLSACQSMRYIMKFKTASCIYRQND